MQQQVREEAGSGGTWRQRSIIGLGAVALLAAASLAGATPAGAGQAKVTVCHQQGNGTYQALEVAAPAVGAHLGHGDGRPGTPVPGMTGKVFNSACQPVGGGAPPVDEPPVEPPPVDEPPVEPPPVDEPPVEQPPVE